MKFLSCIISIPPIWALSKRVKHRLKLTHILTVQNNIQTEQIEYQDQ